MALADGVEAIVLRATEAIADHRPAAPIASQIAQGGSLSYGRFLAWRNMVTVEPPNRPAPARPSSSAASRGSDWKYRFTAAVGVEVGEASAANRRTDWKYGVHRLPGPVQRDGAPSPGPGVAEGRRSRRHGPRAHGPHVRTVAGFTVIQRLGHGAGQPIDVSANEAAAQITDWSLPNSSKAMIEGVEPTEIRAGPGPGYRHVAAANPDVIMVYEATIDPLPAQGILETDEHH